MRLHTQSSSELAKREEEERLALQAKLDAEEQAKAKAKQEEEMARIRAVEDALPLQVRVAGGSSFSIEPSIYRLHANQIELPLRYLIEKMGGKVEWQAETKTAKAHYGIYDMDYDIGDRSIRLYTLGKPTASYFLADVSLQNSQIIVPMRNTIDSLGGRITNAVMDSDYRAVSMTLHPLYFIKENNSLLKNTLFAMGE